MCHFHDSTSFEQGLLKSRREVNFLLLPFVHILRGLLVNKPILRTAFTQIYCLIAVYHKNEVQESNQRGWKFSKNVYVCTTLRNSLTTPRSER